MSAVLITGASSGVGAAAAERFAREGYDVALVARGAEGLEHVAGTVRAHGARALVLAGDVTDREFLDDAVWTVLAEFDRLDVLVVDAAITIFGPFSDVESDDFDRVFSVTFGGAVNATRAALPALEAARGVIVAVGSLNSRVPLPAWSSYCSAKHAERGFFNTLSVELRAAGSPVRIAQLHPGAINTPVWTNTPAADGRLPRRPPEAYDARKVAEGVLRLARDPKPETLFGAEAIALDRLWALARPAADIVLDLMFRYFTSGERPAPDGTAGLHEPFSDGAVADGIVGRPSVTSALRGLASLRPW